MREMLGRPLDDGWTHRAAVDEARRGPPQAQPGSTDPAVTAHPSMCCDRLYRPSRASEAHGADDYAFVGCVVRCGGYAELVVVVEVYHEGG